MGNNAPTTTTSTGDGTRPTLASHTPPSTTHCLGRTIDVPVTQDPGCAPTYLLVHARLEQGPLVCGVVADRLGVPQGNCTIVRLWPFVTHFS